MGSFLALARPAVVLLLVSVALCGGVYPLLVTAAAKAAFPQQAEGSLIRKEGVVVGSALLGQPFESPRYFWGRPSATTPPYNAAASGASNLVSTNPAWREQIEKRKAALHKADPTNQAAVPADLLTASASGLDPHISPQAAEYQVARVARARSMSEREVRARVAAATEKRQFGLLGEDRVNVLKLNLALDEK